MLEEDIKTKEVVQGGYDEMTENIATKTIQHKETMDDLQTRITEGRQKSAHMTAKVTYTVKKIIIN